MNVKSHLKSALINIKINKSRSLLTLLGLIIGISAVMVVIGFGEGNRRVIMQEIEKAGADILWVQLQVRFNESMKDMSIPEENMVWLSFSENDLKAVKSLCPAVKEVAPVIVDQKMIKYGNRTAYYTILGTVPAYMSIHKIALAEGRLFSDFDLEAQQKVCLLENSPDFRTIFNLDYPLGKEILIGEDKFKIIGLVEEKKEKGSYQEGKIYIPLTTIKKIKQYAVIQKIYVQAKTALLLQEAEKQINNVLRIRHLKDNFIFEMHSMIDLFKSAQKINKSTTLAIVSIAGVSLLVGAIGIMNIMLVSVGERTREIGIRRAIGASKADIAILFLTEAVVLCFCGGIFGVFCGAIGILLIIPLSSLPVVIPFWGIAISICSAIIVGIAAGIYPALKASKLNPIEALKYE